MEEVSQGCLLAHIHSACILIRDQRKTAPHYKVTRLGRSKEAINKNMSRRLLKCCYREGKTKDTLTDSCAARTVLSPCTKAGRTMLTSFGWSLTTLTRCTSYQ